MKKLILSLTCLSSMLFTVNTMAAGDGSLILSFAGVANDTEKAVRNNETNNEVNIGGGVLIEANINEKFGIETGALLINRQYDAEKGEARLLQETKRLHIPIMARFWVTDWFSVATGPFVAFRTGDTKTSLKVGDTELGSLETSADESVEYGIDTAATFNISIDDKSGIFLEGRYSDLFDQDNTEKFNEVSALAGFKMQL
ncbi:MAG: outer membrane beta-barrel protein [Bdellovibrionota bacterium]|nr:outer membrane beta-barrel protein [Bdellovibrionota bacterium]